MKLSSKIVLIIIAVAIVIFLSGSLVFYMFFVNYLEEQEKDNINAVGNSVISYLDEKKSKYLGSVNDWGHWDDTYYFMDNNNEEYLNSNLNSDTFVNLDVNFIIFLNQDNTILSKTYYDLEDEEFNEFPTSLATELEEYVRALSDKEELSEIVEFDGQFYFISATKITDSLMHQQENGTIVMGRIIDDSIITSLEEISKSKIIFSTKNNLNRVSAEEFDIYTTVGVPEKLIKVNKNEDTVQLKLTYPDNVFLDSNVVVTITKDRDIFEEGMKQLRILLMVYLIFIIFIAVIIYNIIDEYVSKPILNLINKITSFDLSKDRYEKIQVKGKDEFALLGNTVNDILDKIEIERKNFKDSERKYRTLISNLQGMVYRCKNDRNWTMEYVSPGCYQLTGYLPEDLLASKKIDFNSLIKKEYQEILWTKWQEAINEKKIFRQEYIIITQDGREKWVWEEGQAVFSEDGGVIALEGIITDITEIKLAEYKALENEEKLRATLLSVGDGVITTDQMGKIQFLNPIAQQLTGWNQQDAFGKQFEDVFNIINEYTREKSESPIKRVFEKEETIELANNTLLISKNGKEIPIEDTASPIRDKNGNIIGVVLVFRDFSEKKERQQQIEFLSYHDQLTGLYNRRFYEEELRRLDTARNYPFSIISADVNGLKTINDAFGHETGDQLVQKVAEIIKKECRADDIIARTGGDEFIILLPKTDSQSAKVLVNRIKSRIEQEKIMNINISISFGWETKNEEDQDILGVIKSAEDFMYKKKILENSSKRSAVIKTIINTLHLKNSREQAHSNRVGLICEAIGKAYNLSDDEIKEIKVAGELHDIGKIAVDDVILNKPGKLLDTEWEELKKHPEIGYRLLGTSGEFYSIAEFVFAHHEKWDGTGYPRGLKGKEINWKARIIGIADAYDAMTSERSYRKALSVEEAILEIKENSGTQFDPDISKVFVEKVLGRKW